MSFVFTATQVLSNAIGQSDEVNVKATLEGTQDTTGKVLVKMRAPGWTSVVAAKNVFIGDGELDFRAEPPTFTIYKIVGIGHFDDVCENDLFDIAVTKGTVRFRTPHRYLC